MASTTTNIGLTKPAGTDQALISAINGNMDIIDTKMGAVGNTSVQGQITALSDQIATLQSGKTNFHTTLLSLAKNGGSDTWEVPLQSVGVYLLMAVGHWNSAWRYIGMVYKNDSTSGLIALESTSMLSVSISGNTLTFTNNNADNSQNVRCTLIG